MGIIGTIRGQLSVHHFWICTVEVQKNAEIRGCLFCQLQLRVELWFCQIRIQWSHRRFAVKVHIQDSLSRFAFKIHIPDSHSWFTYRIRIQDSHNRFVFKIHIPDSYPSWCRLQWMSACWEGLCRVSFRWPMKGALLMPYAGCPSGGICWGPGADVIDLNEIHLAR